MSRGKFHKLATALYDGPGDGSPRYREGIIQTLERALEQAYEQGKRDAWPDARARALREVVSALTGARNALSGLERTIEKDLAEIEPQK